jgi:hypothetical protein
LQIARLQLRPSLFALLKRLPEQHRQTFTAGQFGGHETAQTHTEYMDGQR